MNIKNIKRAYIFSSAILALVSCTPHYVSLETIKPKTLTAIGLGTADIYKNYSAEQRRLLSIRSSKMDAYRNLAEQVEGLTIQGQTTVSDMIVKNDRYKLYVDAFLKGAVVKSITPVNADTYETTLEIRLTPKFFHCLDNTHSVVYGCFTEMQNHQHFPAYHGASNNHYNVSHKSINTASITPYTCSSIECYKHPDISGFYNQAN